MSDKKLYVVETISMFRMRYIVEDTRPDWAEDTVVMGLGQDDFREFSQHHVDEVITSTREITEAEMIALHDADNPHFTDWPAERKLQLINRPK
jgi:hypothetical protein